MKKGEQEERKNAILKGKDRERKVKAMLVAVLEVAALLVRWG